MFCSERGSIYVALAVLELYYVEHADLKHTEICLPFDSLVLGLKSDRRYCPYTWFKITNINTEI